MNKRLEKLRENNPGLYNALRLVAACVIGGFFIWALIGPVFKIVQGVPDTPQAVLKSAALPTSYRLDMQSIRTIKLDGDELLSNRAADLTVDEKRNKFRLAIDGYTPKVHNFLGDGSHTLRQDDDTWNLTTNIAPKSLRSINAQDVLKADPHFVTTKGAWRGDQAWVISFKPTSEMLQRVLMYQALGNETSYTAEANDLQKGDYKTDYAYTWVTRQDRQLLAIDMHFTVGKATYHYLIKYNNFGFDGLKDLNIARKNS